jgi:hypothetical protein
MSDLWKALEAFDPHTADPYVCWVLLEMEQRGYIKIRNGTIILTEQSWEVLPEPLDDTVPLWKCKTAKGVLMSESPTPWTLHPWRPFW